MLPREAIPKCYSKLHRLKHPRCVKSRAPNRHSPDIEPSSLEWLLLLRLVLLLLLLLILLLLSTEDEVRLLCDDFSSTS